MFYHWTVLSHPDSNSRHPIDYASKVYLSLSLIGAARKTDSNMSPTFPLMFTGENAKIWHRSRSEAIWFSNEATHRKTKTRNSSGDEIANVNFLNDDIVHALQNTVDSYINSATDRRGYVLLHRFIKFSEITQCKCNVTAITPFKVIQGHQFWYQSKAHIWLPVVININLPPILHRFQLTADYLSNFR